MAEHDGPKKPWWDDDGLTLKQFVARLNELRQRRYRHEEVEYTHDIFFNETLIGEAACVEDAGAGLVLGVFSFVGLAPSYCVLDPRFVVLPKSLTRR